MKRSILLILIVALYGITGAVFWATSVKTVSIYPDKDSYSWESVPLANNGHSNNFEITSYNKPPFNMRGWIEFNTTSIPSNVWITSATMRLRVWHISKTDDPIQNVGGSTGRIYGAYRLLGPWEEDGVNWVNQPNFTENHYAAASVPPGQGGWDGPLLWMNWDVTDIMKDWQSGVKNYGLVVKDTQEGAPVFYTTQFFTKDQVPNESYYPRLIVTYISPNALAALGGIIVAEGAFIIAIRTLKKTDSNR